MSNHKSVRQLKRPLLALLACLGAAVFGSPMLVQAADDHAAASSTTPTAPLESHADSSGEDHRHHVGLFIGGTTRFEHAHEEHGAAVGLEYEYRFAHHFGIGGLWEYSVIEGGRDTVLAVPLSWHPWRELKLAAGPGIELSSHDPEFVFRVAAGYDFKIGRVTIAPEVAGDFTREAQTLVYGLTVGFGF